MKIELFPGIISHGERGHRHSYTCLLGAHVRLPIGIILKSGIGGSYDLCMHGLGMLQLGFLRGSVGKESTCNAGDASRHRFDPQVRKISWRRKWQPTPIFLPGEFHRQRNLAGYSSWGTDAEALVLWPPDAKN